MLPVRLKTDQPKLTMSHQHEKKIKFAQAPKWQKEQKKHLVPDLQITSSRVSFQLSTQLLLKNINSSSQTPDNLSSQSPYPPFLTFTVLSRLSSADIHRMRSVLHEPPEGTQKVPGIPLAWCPGRAGTDGGRVTCHIQASKRQ